MSDRTSDPPQLPDRWQDIQANATAIAIQHIQACKAQINGYWDESDQFYETVRFSQSLTPELISSSIGVTPNHEGGVPWLNLKYALKVAGSEGPMTSGRSLTIGELTLILNDSLEVIDENWLIDIHSPYIVFQ